MKKQTLLMWCAVAFLGAWYWDAYANPLFVVGLVAIVTPVVLAVLSVMWGL